MENKIGCLPSGRATALRSSSKVWNTRTAKFIRNRIAGGRMQTTRYGLGHILDIDGL